LKNTMLLTKDAQIKVVQDVEQYKTERNSLTKRKEALNGELKVVDAAIARTRARIVQSPERIKRSISSMSASALEEKKAVAMHETKARNLQAKINALHSIEKDVRGCIEQLQTIDTEIQKLQRSQKDLAKQQNDLEGKVIGKK